jgi:hypothetical protein
MLNAAFQLARGHCIQHMTHANLNTAFSIWHMPIGTLHSAYDTCQLEHCIHHMTHANQDSLFSIWHMQIWTLFSTWHIQLYHWVKLRCIKETYYFSLNNQSIYVIGVNLDYNYFVMCHMLNAEFWLACVICWMQCSNWHVSYAECSVPISINIVFHLACVICWLQCSN